MDASVISALAGLLGAGIGGLTSVLASWLNQHTQARAQWLAQDRARLQELYKDFIEEASRSHIDSLQSESRDLPALIGLSRMRIMSLPKSWKAPIRSSERSSISISRRTRHSPSCATCSIASRSIFSKHVQLSPDRRRPWRGWCAPARSADLVNSRASGRECLRRSLFLRVPHAFNVAGRNLTRMG
jgi:hypothetical protein